MRLSAATLLALVASTNAHTVMSEIYIDGQAQVNHVCAHPILLIMLTTRQGDATCVRMPKYPNNATFPVNDLSSTDMACG